MLLGSAQHRANKKNEEDIFHSTYIRLVCTSLVKIFLCERTSEDKTERSEVIILVAN